jgi:cytochrome c
VLDLVFGVSEMWKATIDSNDKSVYGHIRTMEDLTMSMKLSSKLGLFALSIVLAGCERDISYAGDVQPLLLEYCAECHDDTGEGVAASGFSVSSYDSVMKGTKFGAVVIPGSSISSSLYHLVAQKTAPEIQMPPHHKQSLSAGRGAPLEEEQVEIIRAWIDQGAKNN